MLIDALHRCRRCFASLVGISIGSVSRGGLRRRRLSGSFGSRGAFRFGSGGRSSGFGFLTRALGFSSLLRFGFGTLACFFLAALLGADAFVFFVLALLLRLLQTTQRFFA